MHPTSLCIPEECSWGAFLLVLAPTNCVACHDELSNTPFSACNQEACNQEERTSLHTSQVSEAVLGRCNLECISSHMCSLPYRADKRMLLPLHVIQAFLYICLPFLILWGSCNQILSSLTVSPEGLSCHTQQDIDERCYIGGPLLEHLQ